MAAASASLHTDLEVALTTALQELTYGAGATVIWVVATADIYVSRDDGSADGGSVSATARFRVPANVIFPIRKSGKKTFIAAVSGTATAHLHGSNN